VANDLGGIARRWRLDDGQVETVVAELLQAASGFGKLDQKSAGLALAARQAFEVTQEGRLMLATEQDARCAGRLAGRQWA